MLDVECIVCNGSHQLQLIDDNGRFSLVWVNADIAQIDILYVNTERQVDFGQRQRLGGFLLR